MRWQRFFRELKHSRFGLKVLQRMPQRIRDNMPYEAIPLWIASVLTGLVSVFYEKLFEWFEKGGEAIFHHNPYLIFVSAPVFMLLGWFLVDKYDKNSGGSGIPQLMAAVEIAGTRRARAVNILLSIKTIVIKISSSCLILLGGGAIGREGPTLQISGSIFHTVYRFIPDGWAKVSHKIMIITGGASGLAAAFNTPLGGIVYVVEELTKSHIGKFRTAVFSAVIISGMSAQLFLGSYLYLGYPKLNPMPLTGIVWVILLSVISGYAGALFSKILLYINKLRKQVNKRSHQILVVLLLSLSFATLVFFAGTFTMGTGKPLINRILFEPGELPWYMFPARFFGSVLTFSVGGAGGIFATSLSSGASLGHFLVNFLNITGSYHNLLVLVCMIGFLTGVTRSPFTAAILVLEMTDRHSAIFYFLLAGTVSNLAAGQLMSGSFYEIQKESFLRKIRSIRIPK
ncbi:hypothetical protein TK44_05390 [Jiulongibacter sediminis]|nr:hypothetical protein TK44_05390 [Jiulongibacter sediminis]